MEKDKLIFWDIDGTLLYCGADGTIALNQTFQKLFGIEDGFYKAGIGHAMDYTIVSKVINLFQIRDTDIEQIKSEYQRTLRSVLENDKRKKVLPGIMELLDYLESSTSCFNALLTSNFRCGAEEKLKSIGLNHYFQVGGFGDEPGEKWDAATRGIIAAEAFFDRKFEKENIYIVGDSIYDIKCAKKIGVTGIGVATGYTDYQSLYASEPDFLYKDLSNWTNFVQEQKWK